MRRRVVMCLPLVLVIAASFGAVSQMSPDSNWTPGTYWTYDTSVTHEGISTEGALTILVLEEDFSYGLHRWNLAIITQWYDGTEILAVAVHSSPLNPFPWKRWPLIVEFIPPKHLPYDDISSTFRMLSGTLGAPRFDQGLSIEVTIRQTESWSESIRLTELQRGTERESECVPEESVAVQHEWGRTLFGNEEAYVEGTAWWSTQHEWWVYAEGIGTMGLYEICLSATGVLSNDDMLLRLANAIESTAAIDPDYADSLRGRFERSGFNLPTE